MPELEQNQLQVLRGDSEPVVLCSAFSESQPVKRPHRLRSLDEHLARERRPMRVKLRLRIVVVLLVRPERVALVLPNVASQCVLDVVIRRTCALRASVRFASHSAVALSGAAAPRVLAVRQ